MDYSVEKVCALIVRDGLQTQDAVKQVYRRWKADPKAGDANASHFLRWLVAQRFLTDDQVKNLVRGQKAVAKVEKPPQAAPPVPAYAPEPEWDVELVQVQPPQPAVISIRGLTLTRRDLVMLAIGAGTVTAVGLVTFVLSSRKRGE
jgi:hypothetical protein